MSGHSTAVEHLSVPLAEHPSLKAEHAWNLAARIALQWSFTLGERGHALEHVTIVGTPASPVDGAFKLDRDEVILARAAELLGKKSVPLRSDTELHLFDLSQGAAGDYLARQNMPPPGGVLILALVPTTTICQCDGDKPPTNHPSAYERSLNDVGDGAWATRIIQQTKPDIIISFGHPDAYITADKIATQSPLYRRDRQIDTDDAFVQKMHGAVTSAAHILAQYKTTTQIAARTDGMASALDGATHAYVRHLVTQKGRGAIQQLAKKFGKRLQFF